MSSKTERVELRLDSEIFDQIDDWRSKEIDLPNRSEAIRRLVQKGLSASDRQAFTNLKLQIMLAARMPNSETFLTDSMIFAFVFEVYPVLDSKQGEWAAPYEPCFSISKDMTISLFQYLEDIWNRKQSLTFYELEKAFRSKEWDRHSLLCGCRYIYLNDNLGGLWESILTPGEHPAEAAIITKPLNRQEIWIG